MKAATVLAVVAVLCISSFAMAQDANARRPRDPNMMPLRGQVVSVAADGNVVVKQAARRNQEAKEVTVATDSKTVVTIDGKDAKVSELVKDLYVTITPSKGVAQKIVATKEAPARGGRRGGGAAGGAGAAPR